MTDHRIDIHGWQVADVVPARQFDSYRVELGGRLTLFRTNAAWTLLSFRTRTTNDDLGHPQNGEASVRAITYASLDELKAAMTPHDAEDWRALVLAGTRNSDPDLMLLWAPVQIDHDLDESSVHRHELAADGAGRRHTAWRERALALAVARLEEIGFVVLEADADCRQVFPGGLGREWANPILGAVVAARRGHRVQLVVAIDDFGEIYTRTPDATFTPGERRRHPPRPLTERELDEVEEIRRRRLPAPKGRS